MVQFSGQGQSFGPMLQLHAHLQGSCRIAASQKAHLHIGLVSVFPPSKPSNFTIQWCQYRITSLCL